MLVPVGWKVGSQYIRRPPPGNQQVTHISGIADASLSLPHRVLLPVRNSNLSFTLKTRHPAVASGTILQKYVEIQKANEEERIMINPIIPMQVRVHSETGLSTPGPKQQDARQKDASTHSKTTSPSLTVGHAEKPQSQQESRPYLETTSPVA
ncbi:hypothetical protein CSPX01_14694 [Colletotrichum filicis]|nr:hypothetical protein CSPX01_14694 [Colletotrichum filicis]